jgi:hypothetical protein
MAEKGQTRDPSSHRTPGQIKRKNHGYDARPEMIARRMANNKARAIMMKAGKVHKGDGKDVAHKKSLDSGGTTVRENLTVQSQKKNRGWRRGGAQPK